MAASMASGSTRRPFRTEPSTTKNAPSARDGHAMVYDSARKRIVFFGGNNLKSVFGLNDTKAGYNCIPNASYLRGDVLIVRYASPWVSGAFVGTQLYLRSSLFEGKLFAGADEALAVNVVLDQPQSIHDLVAHAYYIGNSGRTCTGQPVPSLFRVRLDNNSQPVVEELLPGVEHFQVQYGVGGQYIDADAVADWSQVVTARYWLLIRSECIEDGFTDGRTYTLGDQVYTPNDSFRRQMYSSVVMLRN